MSYILEALVKSERARLQGSAAARHSLLPAVAEDSPPRPAWHYGLLAGLLALNAAVLYPRLRPPAPTPFAAAAATSRADAPAKPIALAAPAPAVAPTTAQRRAIAPPATPRPAPSRRQTETPPSSPSPSPAPAPARAPAPAAASEPSPAAADSPPRLPTLAVAGFIRNPGAPDMVIVNDKLLREGDEVEPGLRLEKILGDGLVFDYKGYRFKR